MKKIFILLFFISNIALCKDNFLDPYWMGDETIEKSADSANLDSLNGFIGNLTEVTLDSLESAQDSENKDGEKKFRFTGMQTSLGLGFSGQLGILTFGGTKVLMVNWERILPKPKNLEEEESFIANSIRVTESTTKNDLEKDLEPLIKSLTKSKKVRDEKLLRKNLREVSGNFLAHVKGLSASNSKYLFFPNKIRLELDIEASGKIVTPVPIVLVKVAVPIKIRIEFIRIMPKSQLKSVEDVIATSDLNETEKKIATQTKSLLEKLSQEVAVAYEEQVKDGDMEKRGLTLKSIGVGIGLSVEGNVGVATLKASGVPTIFFAKAPKKAISIDKGLDLEEEIPILMDTMDKRIGDTPVQIKRRQVRKGMKKALDFAYKFAEKIQKKSKNRPSAKWKFKSLESRYIFTLGGTVGPVKLMALPHFILQVENLN